MFKQFCQGHNRSGIHSLAYRCNQLEVSHFCGINIQNEYASLWKDFVVIRIDLIDHKLKQLFLNDLKVNENDLNKFYTFFQHYRNLPVMLPLDAHGHNTGICSKQLSSECDKMQQCPEFSEQKWDTSELTNFGNLNPFYRFIIIWNGTFKMFHKRIQYHRRGPKYGHGLEYKIEPTLFPNHFEKSLDKEMPCAAGAIRTVKNASSLNNDEKLEKLYTFVWYHVLTQFAQTNVFGKFVNKNFYSADEATDSNINDEHNHNVMKLIFKLMLNNDGSDFTELVKYCCYHMVN